MHLLFLELLLWCFDWSEYLLPILPSELCRHCEGGGRSRQLNFGRYVCQSFTFSYPCHYYKLNLARIFDGSEMSNTELLSPYDYSQLILGFTCLAHVFKVVS